MVAVAINSGGGLVGNGELSELSASEAVPRRSISSWNRPRFWSWNGDHRASLAPVMVMVAVLAVVVVPSATS